MSEVPQELANLRAEVMRLRSALQNIATTLESASDDSLQVALRMVKGMALTTLATPSPLRPPSTPGSARPNSGGTPGLGASRPKTEPGIPAFESTPVPQRPTTAGDQMVVIKPTSEPAKKITEPSLEPHRDPER